MYGSKNLAQEHECNIPEVQWIGLRAEDVITSPDVNDQPMALSKRDRITAMSMLASPEWRDESDDILPGLVEAMVELQRMLMLNRKAEIQSLDEMPGGLEDWLTDKLKARVFL